MSRELLQMDQLKKFYSLIANDGAKIRFTSKSDNYMSFEVKGSYESAVMSFCIIYANNDGRLSAVESYRDMIALGSYGWVKGEDGSYRKQSTDLCSFKLGSKGYKLLTDLFNNIKKLDFSTYDGKEFCQETFSPFIKEMHNLDGQRTTDGTDTIDSTTTELFNSSQLEESTTEEVDHEIQENSEYVTTEPAHLEEQKFYFASNETGKEINNIVGEIRRSNASNRITPENIMDVVFRSNSFTSRNVSAFSEFNSTDAILPKLPNESGIAGTTVAGLSTLSIGVMFGILGFLGAAVEFGYWLWDRKNRESSYDIERAGVRDEVEAEEQSSMLDEINIESGMYQSFQLDTNQRHSM